jgi:hypothetical protein
MDFKKATDALFDGVGHKDLADELGVSIPTIRQARLGVSAKAHRPPPKGWERAVIGLAENRIRYYHELIGALENAQRQKMPGSGAGGIAYEPAHNH